MSTDTRTEKEKMLAAEMYNAFTPQLVSERLACREVIHDYNATRPSEEQKRVELIRKLFGRFGANSYIETPFQCDYGYNIHWGETSAANYNLVIIDTYPIYVGNYVLMGPNVKLYGGTHPTDPQERLDGLEYGKSIRIGNNVWLGGGVIVVAGATIGDNSVIGAGSVVVKDIPANVVAVGNPCRVVKQLQAPTRQPSQFQQLTGYDQMATDTRTEKEKMLAGEMYNAFTPQLLSERSACKEIIHDYNATRPSEEQKRGELIRKLFGRFGANSVIEPPFRCDYGYNIYWGENSFANYNLIILDICPIYIGNYVLMGPDVKLYGATHPTDPQERLDGLEYGKPIRIGNNVWLGGGVIVVAGATIGDNSVIGAGSVVVKDIPANVVAVGNPCRVVKQLEAPTRQPSQFQQLTGFDQAK